MQVWVLLYHHKHGVDVNLFTRKFTAYDARIKLIEFWMEEELDLPERAELRKLLDEKQYTRVVEYWEAHTSEFFEIEDHPLRDCLDL